MIRINDRTLLQLIVSEQFELLNLNEQAESILNYYKTVAPHYNFSIELAKTFKKNIESKSSDTFEFSFSLPNFAEIEFQCSQLKAIGSGNHSYLLLGKLRQTILKNTLSDFIKSHIIDFVKHSENLIALVLSKDGNIVFWNKGAEKITNLTEKEKKQLTWQDLFPDTNYCQAVKDKISGFLKGKYSEYSFLTHSQSHDQPNLIIEWDVQLIKDSNGDIGGLFLMGQNQTNELDLYISAIQSELFYRSLFEKARDAIFLMKDGKFKECNAATLKIFNCQKFSEILEHEPWEFSPDLQPDGTPSQVKANEYLEKAISGSPQNFMWLHQRKGGQLFHANVTLNRIDISGEVFLHAIVRDITKQVELQNKVMENEKKLISILDSIPNPIYYQNTDGIFLSCNKAFSDLIGVHPEEIKGKTIQDIAPPKLAILMLQNDKQLLKTGNKVHYETFIENKDGQMRDTIIYKSPVFDNQQQIIGLVGVLLDITDTKIAQNQIRESEQKFRTLSEFAPVAIIIYRNNSIIYANNEVKKLTGYSEYELLKMKFWQIVHTEDQELVKKRGIMRQRGGSVLKRYEVRIQNKKGETRWVSLKADTITYNNETAVIVSAIDITKNKRDALFQEVMFNVSEIGKKSYDESHFYSAIYVELGRIFDISNLFFGIYNAQKQTLSFPFMEDEKDEFNEISVNGTISKLVLDSGKSLLLTKRDMLKLEVENKIKLVGSTAACWMGAPLVLGDDVLGLIVLQSYTDENAYNQDDLKILEFFSAQIALAFKRLKDEKLNKLLHKALMKSPIGTLITNKRGSIEYINPILLEKYGYTYSEVIGKNPSIFKSGKTPNSVYEELWTTILSGKIWQGDIQNKKKEGTLFWEHLLIFPVFSDSGEITHFISIKEDIDQKKNLEERMIQTERLESLGMLVGGIAHDFNNILTAINGFAEIGIIKSAQQEGLKKYFSSILESGKSASKLTRQLLAFSRKQTIQPEIISSEAFITQKLDLLKRLIPEDISIETQFESRDTFISADPVQLEQILINVVVNARDAILSRTDNREKKIIITHSQVNLESRIAGRIEIINPGSYSVFTISDTGTGIPEGILRRILEPFFTTKPKDRGTGLGLSTVYGILKQNNGFIDIITKEDEGTVIKTYWPTIRTTHSPHPPDSTRVSNIENFSSKNVLVVEDDHHVLSFSLTALKQMGINAITAMDGLEAEKILDNQIASIDLIITDLVMPGMNGHELLQKVENSNKKIPVIIISGYDNRHDLSLSTSLPHLFLKKPFSISELESAIREVLEDK